MFNEYYKKLNKKFIPCKAGYFVIFIKQRNTIIYDRIF